jgi:DNA-binding MarR family transcriptional regulator
MSIRETDIRSFRGALRQLERIVNSQNKRCCPKVSMPQCHVLLQIDIKGKSTITELAKTLDLDISTISRTVDSLVKSKSVDRIEDPDDRRFNSLRLSTEGRKLAAAINFDADEYFSKVIEHIPEKRRLLVLRSFEILIMAFSDTERERQKSSEYCSCNGT